MGERFGPYELIERIGAGGMCEVFRARCDGSDRPVALKRLHRELEQQPAAVDLFLTEADLAVLLRHPNLVNAHDSGEIDGRYYIAMELIDGLDLAHAQLRALERGLAIEVALAVHIATEVCRGLDYLHRATSPAGRPFGLVHRDVSPDNVFLTRQGQVKLADLGIAKLGQLETVTTVVGGVKGKLTYMAPEQVRGEQLDLRTDLFAVALILYELVTGHRPYARREGELDVDLALRVRDASLPAPRKLEPELHPDLDAILRRALQRRPRRRQQSCAELADALESHALMTHAVRGAADVARWVAQLGG
ncbi:MAG: serine/threonine protein kinase [Deltaproteobacteria bacterium]|nr:serine/threonine protein kinase [Deltaproteobacteria bacterium]